MPWSDQPRAREAAGLSLGPQLPLPCLGSMLGLAAASGLASSLQAVEAVSKLAILHRVRLPAQVLLQGCIACTNCIGMR